MRIIEIIVFLTFFAASCFGCDQQLMDPQDPLLYQQPYLKTTNTSMFWKIFDQRNICGDSDVGVAVIGTGADISHPDLYGQIDTVWSKDFTGEGNPFQDPVPHDTRVIGEIAALHNDIGIAGMTTSKKIIMYRIWKVVIDPNAPPFTSPYYGTMEGILAAIQELKKLPYKKLVINMSFSIGAYSQEIHDAMADLTDKAVFVTAAANGDGGGKEYPCIEKLPNTICVGSNSGEESHPSHDYGGNVTLLAPGESIMSTYGDGYYGPASGNSFAVPLVASIASLLWDAHPEASPAEIVKALQTKSINPTLSPEGLPTLDAILALEALENPSAPEKIACVEAFTGNWYLAPGNVVSLYGQDFADQEYFTDFVHLPDTLGGLQVILDGTTKLPLFYVGPGQINAQMPSNVFLLFPHTRHTLEVGDKSCTFIVHYPEGWTFSF